MEIIPLWHFNIMCTELCNSKILNDYARIIPPWNKAVIPPVLWYYHIGMYTIDGTSYRATFGIPIKWINITLYHILYHRLFINCYSWNNSKNPPNCNISKNDLWHRNGYIVIFNNLVRISECRSTCAADRTSRVLYHHLNHMHPSNVPICLSWLRHF